MMRVTYTKFQTYSLCCRQTKECTFTRGFYPLCSNETTSLKNDLNLHIYLACCVYDFLVRCFNKKGEKSLYKSISKLIYIDTYYLLFIIIVTECDVLSPSTKFSSLHHKKVVVLRG